MADDIPYILVYNLKIVLRAIKRGLFQTNLTFHRKNCAIYFYDHAE